MSKAPEGCRVPRAEEFEEWLYRYCERLGIGAATAPPGEQLRARALFEADRAVEGVFAVQCDHGWIVEAAYG